jgi:hypothetical protein
MMRWWRIPVVLAAGAVLIVACGDSSRTVASFDPDPNNQVQVATSEKAREDTANVSSRLKAAGYTVVGSAPAGAGPGGFVVTFGGGGVVVVLVLDSNAQADAVARGFSSSSPDPLVQMLGKHVYAANTLGTAAGRSISKAEFDKLVAAGEGGP